MRTTSLLAAGLACSALLVACSSSPPAPTGHPIPGPTLGRATPGGSAPVGVAQLQDAFRAVAKKVMPSVVQIKTDSGLGSGIVFDGSGDIVTNAHVVADSSSFEVTLADGHSYPASLVGAFVPDDLAVVKVSQSGLSVPAATFADSATLQVGDLVMAVGNPLGLQSSVTNGIVSATGRTVSEGNGVIITNAIQTSAAINPGNSGGALVDLSGDVVGIPTLAATDPQLGGGAAPGIGFAIPSNTVRDIAGQLIANHGHVVNSHRAYLGIRAATVTGGGVLITSVDSGGPADHAGLQAGDVITSVDGHDTPTSSSLTEVLATLKPGDVVKVGVIRGDGSQATVTVTLGQIPGGG